MPHEPPRRAAPGKAHPLGGSAGVLVGQGVVMSFWSRARRHKSFMVGGLLVALLVLTALLSFVWTPYPAGEIDVPNKLQPASSAHWLGTDSLGRDIVSMLVVGARYSIAVGVIAVGIGITAGVALGL